MAQQCGKRNELMPKLSKTTQYAAKYLLETMKMTTKQVAKELGLSAETIVSLVAKEDEATPPKKAKSATSRDLMIRHTAGKQTNNVSIMTQAASQANDSQSKTDHSSKTASREKNRNNSIYKPYGDNKG